ncbi:MAG TPA: hypothetical protein VM143_07940 [Acidimicrobiales bacterium]|nr:hypothetical protein [Acidimicrobiales bacterium]
MTVVQRRVLGGVGGVSAILVLLLLLTRGGDGRAGDRLAVEGPARDAPATTTTTDSSSETTLPVLPVTTGVPVPNATEAPPPTAPPSATPAAPRTASGTTGLSAASSVGTTTVDGKGALLARPASAATRPVDKAKGCASANDAGWKIANCGALRSSGTALLWVVETKGKATRVLVLKEQTAGQWSTVLFAADDAGTAWTSVGVRGEDVSGDGQPELAFGFHRQGAARDLAVDLVDAAAANVVVHRDLSHGVAQTAQGALTTWSAAGDGYDEVAIRFAGGAWRATAPKRVERGAVPASSV